MTVTGAGATTGALADPKSATNAVSTVADSRAASVRI
jgi:hypothetical protein